MRKLIVQQWVTLDGVVAEEDGGLGFVNVRPFAETSDPAYAEALLGLIEPVDTLILGARTYAQSTGWATAEGQGEYGDRLNRMAKVVASTTLTEAPWGDFPAATITADPVATVRQLKRQPGRDLWLFGSLTLMRTLLEAGEVDQFQLLVCPVGWGSGTRLFEDRRELELLDTAGFSTGVVIQKYAVVK